MNIEAGLVQAAVRRTVVPVIQAMYAVGMLGGALLGAVAPRWGCPSELTSSGSRPSNSSPAALLWAST